MHLDRMHLQPRNSQQPPQPRRQQKMLGGMEGTNLLICSRQPRKPAVEALEAVAQGEVEVEVQQQRQQVSAPEQEEEQQEASQISISSEPTPNSNSCARLYKRSRRCWSRSYNRLVLAILSLLS